MSLSDLFPDSPGTPEPYLISPKHHPPSPETQFPHYDAWKQIKEIEAKYGALPDTEGVKALRTQLERSCGKYEECRGERQDLKEKLAEIDGPDYTDWEERQTIEDAGVNLWRGFQTEMSGMRTAFEGLMNDQSNSDLWLSFSEKLKKHLGDNGTTGMTAAVKVLLQNQTEIIEWNQKFQKRASLRAERAEERVRKTTAANEELKKTYADLESRSKKLQREVSTPRNQLIVSGSNSQSSSSSNEDCEQRCQRLQQQLNQANQAAARYQKETATFMQLADDTITKLGGTPPSRHIIEIRSPGAPIFNRAQNTMQVVATNPNAGLNDEEIGGMLIHFAEGSRNIERLLQRNRQLEKHLKNCRAGKQVARKDKDLGHGYLSSDDEMELPSELAGDEAGNNANSTNVDPMYQQYLLGIEYINKALPFAQERSEETKVNGTMAEQVYWDEMVLFLENAHTNLSENTKGEYNSFAEFAMTLQRFWTTVRSQRDAFEREVKNLKKRLAHSREHNPDPASASQNEGAGGNENNSSEDGGNDKREQTRNQTNISSDVTVRLQELYEADATYAEKNGGNSSEELHRKILVLQSIREGLQSKEHTLLEIVETLSVQTLQAQEEVVRKETRIQALLGQITTPEKEAGEVLNYLLQQKIEQRLADSRGRRNPDKAQVKLWETVDQELQNGSSPFEIIQDYSKDLTAERNDRAQALAQIASLEKQVHDAKQQPNAARTDANYGGRDTIEGVRRKIQELKEGAEYDWYKWLENELENGRTLTNILRKGTTELHQYRQQINSLNQRVQELEALIGGSPDDPGTHKKFKDHIDILQKRLTETTGLAKASQISAEAQISQLNKDMKAVEDRHKQKTQGLRDQIAQLEKDASSPEDTNHNLMKVLRERIERMEKEAEIVYQKHKNEMDNIGKQNRNLVRAARKAEDQYGESAQIARLEKDLLDHEQLTKNTIAQLEAEIAMLARENELRNGQMPAGHQTTKELMQSSTLSCLQLQIDEYERRRIKAESLQDAEKVEMLTTQITFLKKMQAQLAADGSPNDVIELLWKVRCFGENKIRDLQAQLTTCEAQKAAVAAGDEKAIFIAQCLNYFKAKLQDTKKRSEIYRKQNPGKEDIDINRLLAVCTRGVINFSKGEDDLADLLARLFRELDALKNDNAELTAEVQDLTRQLEDAGGSPDAGSSENGVATGSQDVNGVAYLQQQIQDLGETIEAREEELTEWREGRITTHATHKRLNDATADIVELKAKIASQAEQTKLALDATYEVEGKLQKFEGGNKVQRDSAVEPESMEIDSSQPGGIEGPSVSLPLRSFVRSLQAEIVRLENRIETLKEERNGEEDRLRDTIKTLRAEVKNLRENPEEGDDPSAELYKQIDTLQTEIEELRERNRNLEAELDGLRANPEEGDDVVAGLREQIETLEVEIVNLKENPKEGGETMAELREEIKAKADEVARLHVSLDEHQYPNLERQLQQVREKLAEYENGTQQSKNDNEIAALRKEVIELREKIRIGNLSHSDQVQQQTPPQIDTIESLRRTHLVQTTRYETQIKSLQRDAGITVSKSGDGKTLREQEGILKELIRKQDAEIAELKITSKLYNKEIQELKKLNADYVEVTTNFEALLNDGQDTEGELKVTRSKLDQKVKELRAKHQKQREARAPSRSATPRPEQFDEHGGRSGNVAPRGDLGTIGEDHMPIFGDDEEGPANREETVEELNYIEGLETTINDMKHEQRHLEDRIQQQTIEIQALGAGGNEGLLAQIKVLKQRIAELEKQLDQRE